MKHDRDQNAVAADNNGNATPRVHVIATNPPVSYMVPVDAGSTIKQLPQQQQPGHAEPDHQTNTKKQRSF